MEQGSGEGEFTEDGIVDVEGEGAMSGGRWSLAGSVEEAIDFSAEVFVFFFGRFFGVEEQGQIELMELEVEFVSGGGGLEVEIDFSGKSSVAELAGYFGGVERFFVGVVDDLGGKVFEGDFFGGHGGGG